MRGITILFIVFLSLGFLMVYLQYKVRSNPRSRREAYEEYMHSQAWRNKRKGAIRRAGGKCQLCGRKDLQLHVHHNSYENFTHEKDSDLVVLCQECHNRYHADKRRKH